MQINGMQVEQLQAEKLRLQKELNLSIKRYTVVNTKMAQDTQLHKKKVMMLEDEKIAFASEKEGVRKYFLDAYQDLEKMLAEKLDGATVKVTEEGGRVDELVRKIKEATARASQARKEKEAHVATKVELEELKELVREKSEEYLGSVEALRKEREEVERLKARVRELEAKASVFKDGGADEEKKENSPPPKAEKEEEEDEHPKDWPPKDEHPKFGEIRQDTSKSFVKDILERAASPVGKR